jgi:hypothetical protein
MRSCVICGEPLEGRRADARHCSGACRAEASRIQRILSGSMPNPYPSLADRLEVARKRTSWANGAHREVSRPTTTEKDHERPI